MNTNIGNLVLNYNLRFVYKKLTFITLIMVLVNIVSYLINHVYRITDIDFIVSSLGGYDVTNVNVMTIMIALFPYLIIAMVIERYISEILEKNHMYLLIRVGNDKLIYVAHLLTIAIIIATMLFMYDFTIVIFSRAAYSFGYIGDYGIRIIGYHSKTYILPKIIFNIYIIQLVGTYAISLCQLYMIKLLKKPMVGFIFILITYILNAMTNSKIFLGEHVFITKINVLGSQWNGQSILEFLIYNGIIIFLLIMLILKKIRIRGVSKI